MQDIKHPRTASDLPADVVGWVRGNFSADEYSSALAALVAAVTETGEYPSARLLRSAAIGSRGRLEGLQYYVRLLAIDWRDVIVAGEYESVNHTLTKVRDLTEPIPLATARGVENRGGS
jgi:hypothetical protein